MVNCIEKLWYNGGLFSLGFAVIYLTKSLLRWWIYKEETEEFWYKWIEVVVYGCTLAWGLQSIMETNILDDARWDTKLPKLLGGSLLFIAALFGSWKIFFSTKWFSPSLNIISATYGEKDVMYLLEQLLARQKSKIIVSNTMFGFEYDPIPNTPKFMKLNFVKGGKTIEREFKENDVFSLE